MDKQEKDMIPTSIEFKRKYGTKWVELGTVYSTSQCTDLSMFRINNIVIFNIDPLRNTEPILRIDHINQRTQTYQAIVDGKINQFEGFVSSVERTEEGLKVAIKIINGEIMNTTEDFKVPEGWSIKEQSDYEITIVKNKEPALPKRWEELNEVDGEYINSDATIKPFYRESVLNSSDRNIIPTSVGGNAVLHLIMLLQLRDRYNDGWVPDWNINAIKWCVVFYEDGLGVEGRRKQHHPLSFPVKELAEQFLNNFIDYLEIAKPLL